MILFLNDLNRGYVALMSVILLGALGVAIMVSVVTQGVISAKTDISLQRSSQARVLATACAEEALQIILETGTTSRSSSLTIASGTCTYIIAKPGASVTISSTGNFGSLVKRILVTLSTTTPPMVLSSWQDVSDF